VDAFFVISRYFLYRHAFDGALKIRAGFAVDTPPFLCYTK